jgi:GH15 family glucan-1,4-alpha-glucosidase
VVARADGYAPIEAYGVLGDGRTVALVSADGQVDWWPVPQINAPPVCAAVLDPECGGHFCLRPAGPHRSLRRYVPGTNVIETTYSCAAGTVRVTDSLNSGNAGRLPWSEMARRIECLAGEMDLVWEFLPGRSLAGGQPQLISDGGPHRGLDGDTAQPTAGSTRDRPWHDGSAAQPVPVITLGSQMVAVVTAGSELTEVSEDRVAGRVSCRAGDRALVALVATDGEPLFISSPAGIDARLDQTIDSWRRWTSSMDAGGRWAEAMQRSALALKALLYEPGGAIAAAATTSLPERVGGPKNYDYRYAWVRDSSFTVDAFINLGVHEEVHAAVSWMLAALRKSAPELHVFYTLDGDPPDGQRDLDVPGYRGSRPVRAGNSAGKQLQLGVYGDLLDMLGLYVDAGHVLDSGTSELLVGLVDQCCQQWRHKDSGIWELAELEHYTISKIGCWVALDRASRLARQGQLPSQNADRWQAEAEAVKAWVDDNCWSVAKRSYTFYSGTDRLDAAVLLAGRTGFERGDRLASTIEAVVGELGRGPMLYRYSGMAAEEGAFIACSFWLVSALAHNGQVERAAELMDDALGMANDLGLLSEQIDPDSGQLLGNIPQGLSHLSLINAAHAVMRHQKDAVTR